MSVSSKNNKSWNGIQNRTKKNLTNDKLVNK